MPRVKVAEYAKHRGISERSVRRYLAGGDIPKKAISKKGRLLFIDQDKADTALDKNNISRREILGKRPENPPKKSPEKPAPTDGEKAATTARAGMENLSFHEARTFKERYKAALLRIELDEKEGRLIDAERVKAEAFGKARAVRDALLNIPDRIGAILAAEADQNRVSEILTGEIRQALEELTKC